MATTKNDLLEGLETIQTMGDLSAWLLGRPDRAAWLSEYAGLTKGGKVVDTDVSAIVETELPVPGPRIFASIDCDDSAEAFALARVQEENTETATFIKHVRTRVSTWERDANGNVAKDDRNLPIARTYEAMRRPARFYRHDGSRPKVRDEFWTDSKGIILSETEQDALSFKYYHNTAGLTPAEREEYEHAGEAKPVFIETGDKWWHRRNSILGTDPTKIIEDPSAVVKILIERDEHRLARKAESEDLARRKEWQTAAPEKAPIVAAPTPLRKRAKTREERKEIARQRRLDKSWRIMTGEQARLEAELSSLEKERDALATELAEFSLKRKLAREIHNGAKDSGLGSYVFENAGPTPEHGDDCLAPYRKLKLDLNLEYEVRKEELDAIEEKLRHLRRAML